MQKRVAGLSENNTEHLNEIKKELVKIKSRYFEGIHPIKKDLNELQSYALNNFIYLYHAVLSEILKTHSNFTLTEMITYFESLTSRIQELLEDIKKKEDVLLKEKDKKKFYELKAEIEKLILEKTRLSFLNNNIKQNEILKDMIELSGDLNELQFSGNEIEKKAVLDVIFKGNNIINKILDFSSIKKVIGKGMVEMNQFFDKIVSTLTGKLFHKEEMPQPLEDTLPKVVLKDPEEKTDNVTVKPIESPDKPKTPPKFEPKKSISYSALIKAKHEVQGKFPAEKVEAALNTIEKYSNHFTLDNIRIKLEEKGWPKDMLDAIFAALKPKVKIPKKQDEKAYDHKLRERGNIKLDKKLEIIQKISGKGFDRKKVIDCVDKIAKMRLDHKREEIPNRMIMTGWPKELVDEILKDADMLIPGWRSDKEKISFSDDEIAKIKQSIDYPESKVTKCIESVEKFSKFYSLKEIRSQLLSSGWPGDLVEKILSAKT